jgi:hypothetical protein
VRFCSRDRRQTLGAVVAWPLAASAQQDERMRRIGVLVGFAADVGGPAPSDQLLARRAYDRTKVVTKYQA